MKRLVVVDSSVWIDYLRDLPTRAAEMLDRLIGTDRLATADLVMFEVLQGVRDERSFQLTQERLSRGALLTICDHQVILQAARNYRHLRGLGITVRKTIDTLIATRCILDDMPLLYNDRDFDPFVEHLGLRSALDLGSGVN